MTIYIQIILEKRDSSSVSRLIRNDMNGRSLNYVISNVMRDLVLKEKGENYLQVLQDEMSELITAIITHPFPNGLGKGDLQVGMG